MKISSLRRKDMLLPNLGGSPAEKIREYFSWGGVVWIKLSRKHVRNPFKPSAWGKELHAWTKKLPGGNLDRRLICTFCNNRFFFSIKFGKKGTRDRRSISY